MEQKIYMISDAAKQVEVESHVLRYWEDELDLPIKRNKYGYRYYTADDVTRLKRVKILKEQGLQLRAIKNALRKEEGNGSLFSLEEKPSNMDIVPLEEENRTIREEGKEDKLYRLQILLKNMMVEAVKEGNGELEENIRESILKELDYQFRMKEEREEEREKERIKREEEHYKHVDELLREKTEKRKKHSFF